MSKYNARKFIVFVLLIPISVGLCACSFIQPKPEEGIWYCDELMIEIDFSVYDENEGVNPPYFAKKYSADGTYQNVECLFDYGDNIEIRSLDYSERYLLGEFVYRQDTFVVTTMDGKYTYIFKRIDDQV